MYIITQFFNLNENQINLGIKILKKYLNDPNIKVIVFSDKPINTDTSRINVYRRRPRLKWKDVFRFVLDNNKMNKEGVLVAEPNHIFDIDKLGINPDLKVQIFQQGIYCHNIQKVYNNSRFVFDDYDYLDISVVEDKIKIAVICHLYYQDMLEEYLMKIKNLDTNLFSIDYYFTLTNDSSTIGQTKWVIEKIKKSFPKANINILPNKGLDIGPFLLSIKEIYNMNKDYKYLIKIHTKKSLKTSGKYFGSKWNNQLMCILDKDKLPKIKELIQKDTLMISSNNWLVKYHHDNLNINKVNQLKNELGIANGTEFVGGTMFWIKFSVIKKYLSSEQITKYYAELEEGYFYQGIKKTEYLTHAFERVLGFMIEDCGQKIIGI